MIVRTLVFFILVRPTVISTSNNIIIGVEFRNIQFSFMITSALPSVSSDDIQWYFTQEGTNNAVPLIPGDDSTHYQFSEDRLTLRIINITRAGDSGNYSVTASNIVGQSTATIILDVQSKFIASFIYIHVYSYYL